MRTGKIAVSLAAVAVVFGLAFAFVRPGSVRADSRPSPAAAAAVVEVDDLVANPDGVKGEVRLRAVVAKVNKAKGVFAVIDAREFKSCGGSIDCAKHYLPVRYAGDLPAVKTVVVVIGEVVRTDKGFVFEARRLEAR